ncbi:hypothetical protein CXG81DRAFT_19008 [Caulochytrium protostelioides]|uniref:Mid2 domain-containing protein n=1 Tax=Caulochytrium protostelioides TaxID=1555241 RepID=A0A4P9WWN3_9FUNG|nr:hypothetical protein CAUPRSCDRAFT_10502 [Caulochytrium protostelioides]RKP01141.1 hypothetical protein CXG81DRAFT_19008 [Caulochytrium protostelioides]|eukprot:RKP01141.1 hypothetical protein CXG81DRAFT_19008 [Caulochytrium protostelioides]
MRPLFRTNVWFLALVLLALFSDHAVRHAEAQLLDDVLSSLTSRPTSTSRPASSSTTAATATSTATASAAPTGTGSTRTTSGASATATLSPTETSSPEDEPNASLTSPPQNTSETNVSSATTPTSTPSSESRSGGVSQRTIRILIIVGSCVGSVIILAVGVWIYHKLRGDADDDDDEAYYPTSKLDNAKQGPQTSHSMSGHRPSGIGRPHRAMPQQQVIASVGMTPQMGGPSMGMGHPMMVSASYNAHPGYDPNLYYAQTGAAGGGAVYSDPNIASYASYATPSPAHGMYDMYNPGQQY